MARRPTNVFDFKAQLLLDNGVNLHTREIMLAEGISMACFKRFARHMELLKAVNNEPITIHLTTSGGDVYAMLAMMDYLQQCTIPITMFALGEISSAGIPIFACADLRITGPFTRFMIHPLSYQVNHSKIQDHKAEMQSVVALEKQVNQYLAKRTNKNYIWWAKAGIEADLHLDAEQSIEIGLSHKMCIKE